MTLLMQRKGVSKMNETTLSPVDSRRNSRSRQRTIGQGVRPGRIRAGGLLPAHTASTNTRSQARHHSTSTVNYPLSHASSPVVHRAKVEQSVQGCVDVDDAGEQRAHKYNGRLGLDTTDVGAAYLGEEQ